MWTQFGWPCYRKYCVFISTLLVGCLAFVTKGDTEQVHSKWVVGRPSTSVATPIWANERQMLLDAVFDMHVPPLLRPVASQSRAGHADASTLRYVKRPEGIDGWRPASQPTITHSNLPKAISGSAQPLSDSPSTHGPLAPPSELSDQAARNPTEGQAPSDSTLPTIELKFRPARRRTAVPTSPGAAQAPILVAPDTALHENENGGDAAGAPLSLGDATTDPTNSDEEAAAPELLDDDSQQSAEPTESPVTVLPVEQQLPPLTRQLTNLRSRVRSVLKGYYRKTLNSRDHDPWEAMHGMLAYGVQSRIRQGGPRGNLVTSVGWLCYNKPCNGQMLMHVTRDGELRAKYGVGLQGHLGQLLAMLAQCRVAPDYPIHVGKQEFTIDDLIEAEKKTCYPNSELTFKLIALQYYLDLNDAWVNDEGVEWDFPRLVREELAQPIRGAACGGTHRLSGLSLTVKRRLMRGEPLDGEYARAAEFIKKYHQYAFRLQNRDGSLSTSWFQGRGDERDIDRRIKTTGHILEWLCYSLSDEELRDQRTIRAVSYLANLMYSNYDHEWEVGPVSHATHALLLYDERVFVPYDSAEYAVSYRPKRSAARDTPQKVIRR
jgi:hypothetical protein